MHLKILTFPLLLALATVAIACNETPEKNKIPKKDITMDIPVHPGTIKMVNMFDKTVKEVTIDKVPKENQFVYYSDDNDIVEKRNAMKAVPIVEVRMFPKNAKGEVVSKDKAKLIWLEMYDKNNKLIKTHSMWRN